MKKIACALLIAAFCAPAFCADDAKEAPKKSAKITKEEMLAKYDEDKDGKLSLKEKNKMKEEMKKEKEAAKEAERDAKKAK